MTRAIDWRGPVRLGRKAAQRDADRSHSAHPEREYGVEKIVEDAVDGGETWYRAVRYAVTEEEK